MHIPRSCLWLVGVLAWSEDPLGYASCSVATGRASFAEYEGENNPDTEAVQKMIFNGSDAEEE